MAVVAQALNGSHEVLLTSPGLVRNQFRDWWSSHLPAVAGSVVDLVVSDHPSDGPLFALARQYFRKVNNMAADPSTV